MLFRHHSNLLFSKKKPFFFASYLILSFILLIVDVCECVLFTNPRYKNKFEMKNNSFCSSRSDFYYNYIWNVSKFVQYVIQKRKANALFKTVWLNCFTMYWFCARVLNVLFVILVCFVWRLTRKCWDCVKSFTCFFFSSSSLCCSKKFA